MAILKGLINIFLSTQFLLYWNHSPADFYKKSIRMKV